MVRALSLVGLESGDKWRTWERVKDFLKSDSYTLVEKQTIPRTKETRLTCSLDEGFGKSSGFCTHQLPEVIVLVPKCYFSI